MLGKAGFLPAAFRKSLPDRRQCRKPQTRQGAAEQNRARVERGVAERQAGLPPNCIRIPSTHSDPIALPPGFPPLERLLSEKDPMPQIKLQDLKAKSPTELLSLAEELQVENASTLRTQDMMFAILKQYAEQGIDIIGEGVVEVLPDGFGSCARPRQTICRSDDIYVHPRRSGFLVRTAIRSRVNSAARRMASGILLCSRSARSFRKSDKARHKVHFVILTPLYPDEKLEMEVDDPTLEGQICV